MVSILFWPLPREIIPFLFISQMLHVRIIYLHERWKTVTFKGTWLGKSSIHAGIWVCFKGKPSTTRWFKVTFSTHSWKGDLAIERVTFSPSQKGPQQNCQVKGVCIFWHLFCMFNSQLGNHRPRPWLLDLKTPVTLAVFSFLFPASEPKTKKIFPKGGFFLGLFASGWSSWWVDLGME